MSDTIELDYSMVLFDSSDVLVSDVMPAPMLKALQSLICTSAIRYSTEELSARYMSDRFDYAMRMLHIPNGQIGILMVESMAQVDIGTCADFLQATEECWSDRSHRFPCYYTRALSETATFVGYISVEEACR